MIVRLAFMLSLVVFLEMAGGLVNATERSMDERLRAVRFDQHPGEKISLDLPFHDENGHPVQLHDYFQGKPVILVPGYYGCTMLCGAVANGLVKSLRDVPLSVGRDFSVVHFSIDPAETAAMAEKKKRSYLKAYDRGTAGDGWHFLTSDEKSAATLAREIGFGYFRDSTSGQYAHPSGIVVMTADGRISRYLFGVNFEPNAALDALHGAGAGKTGLSLQRLLLLCFHYQPLTGKYSGLAMVVLRCVAVVSLAAIAGWIFFAVRAERTAASRPL